MKKVLYLSLIFWCCCLFVNSVEASGANHPFSSTLWDDCVQNNTCIALCAYTNTEQPYPDTNPDYYNKFSSYIYYDLEDKNFYVTWYSQETDINTALHKQNIEHKYVFIEKSVKDILLNNGKCPTYSYVDISGLASEVCFSDSENYCTEEAANLGTKFKGSSEIKYNYENNILSYYENWAFGDIPCSEFSIDKLSDKINQDFQKNFLFGYEIPNFIENSTVYENIEETVINSSHEYKTKCSDEIKNDTTLTEEEKTQKLENLNFTDADVKNEVENSFKQNVPSVSGDKDDTCTGILTAEMTKVVKNILTFIQYLGPVLIILFTSFDFIKASLSGDQSELKKASSRFVKRLIAAVLLFFISIIVSVLFDLAGITVPDDCLLK